MSSRQASVRVGEGFRVRFFSLCGPHGGKGGSPGVFRQQRRGPAWPTVSKLETPFHVLVTVLATIPSSMVPLISFPDPSSPALYKAY